MSLFKFDAAFTVTNEKTSKVLAHFTAEDAAAIQAAVDRGDKIVEELSKLGNIVADVLIDGDHSILIDAGNSNTAAAVASRIFRPARFAVAALGQDKARVAGLFNFSVEAEGLPRIDLADMAELFGLVREVDAVVEAFRGAATIH